MTSSSISASTGTRPQSAERARRSAKSVPTLRVETKSNRLGSGVGCGNFHSSTPRKAPALDRLARDLVEARARHGSPGARPPVEEHAAPGDGDPVHVAEPAVHADARAVLGVVRVGRVARAAAQLRVRRVGVAAGALQVHRRVARATLRTGALSRAELAHGAELDVVREQLLVARVRLVVGEALDRREEDPIRARGRDPEQGDCGEDPCGGNDREAHPHRSHFPSALRSRRRNITRIEASGRCFGRPMRAIPASPGPPFRTRNESAGSARWIEPIESLLDRFSI